MPRTFDITIRATIDDKNHPVSVDDRTAEYANEMGGVAIGAILEDFAPRVKDSDMSFSVKEVL